MPDTDLRVSLVQGDTLWHAPDANRAMYRAQALPLKGLTDLVVLPETFTSGFSNEAIAEAEGMDGPTIPWMRALATELDAAVTGSVQINDHGRVYNRMLFVEPDGHLRHYDKRHLFRMAREHERYAPGRERISFDYRGWRICPLVCYDLRFPVFCRNRHGHDTPGGFDYDLLLFVANWPAPRRHAWRSLLVARAIENLACVVGVNRVGTDGNEVPYAGDSMAIDHLGRTVLDLGERPLVATASFSGADLAAHRERFPAQLDADRFELLPGV